MKTPAPLQLQEELKFLIVLLDAMGIMLVIVVPVIFANAMRWLHGEEEPDAELRKLVRADRRGVGPFMERRGTVVRGEGGGSAA